MIQGRRNFLFTLIGALFAPKLPFNQLSIAGTVTGRFSSSVSNIKEVCRTCGQVTNFTAFYRETGPIGCTGEIGPIGDPGEPCPYNYGADGIPSPISPIGTPGVEGPKWPDTCSVCGSALPPTTTYCVDYALSQVA